jgi:long-chain acyl-CoA synthetase
MNHTPMNALSRQLRNRPKSAALVYHEEVWTYERLAAQAGQLARGLAERGVKPGDRVVLHLVNRPELVIACYACFQLGAIAVPLRTSFTPVELAALLQRLKPAIYIGDDTLGRPMATVDASILAPGKRFVVGEVRDDGAAQPWEVLFNDGTGTALPESPAPHQPALLIATAGTTGEPKFAIHTQASLAATVDLVTRHLGLVDDDLVTAWLPLADAAGLFPILSCFAQGVPFILMERFDADRVLDSIERHHSTWCLGVPTHYVALLERQRVQPRDLASLRICLTGAEVCPVNLQEMIPEEWGVPLHNVWSATEVFGSLTFGLQPGTVSRVSPGALIRLVDDASAEVARGEAGELMIRGDNVVAGYWNDPQATARSFKDGWYCTGDLMRRGDGDDLWFVSRKQDPIVHGGSTISAARRAQLPGAYRTARDPLPLARTG